MGTASAPGSLVGPWWPLAPCWALCSPSWSMALVGDQHKVPLGAGLAGEAGGRMLCMGRMVVKDQARFPKAAVMVSVTPPPRRCREEVAPGSHPSCSLVRRGCGGSLRSHQTLSSSEQLLPVSPVQPTETAQKQLLLRNSGHLWTFLFPLNECTEKWCQPPSPDVICGALPCSGEVLSAS